MDTHDSMKFEGSIVVDRVPVSGILSAIGTMLPPSPQADSPQPVTRQQINRGDNLNRLDI